jgi:D-alanyl-D-alanine carboxypeptidase
MIQRVRWSNMDTASRLDTVMESSVDNKKVFGSLVKIESKDGSIKHEISKGNLANDHIFPIASITKMFTAAIIYQLVDEGRLDLSDTIDLYLTEDELDGLHYFNGMNNGHTITIEHLVSQTSGLPDYFTEKVENKTIFDEIIENDRFITFEEMMERTKSLEPHFLHGEPGKAFYSDINFDILGIIAERITGMSLEDIYREMIFGPLGLEKTELATVDSEFSPIYYNSEVMEVPLALSSFRASGGIISNLDDLMVFLRAFMEGRLFSPSHLDYGEWNEIQFEFHEYRNGMMRFNLTGAWALLGAYEFIGHSGSNSSFAFYCPDEELYIVGTLNQVTDPSVQYRLMTRLVESIVN